MNSIDVEVVYNALIKNCWKYGIQNKIILKDKLGFEVQLIGRLEKVFIKFQKSGKVAIHECETFYRKCEAMDIDRAYFINTGVFDKDLLEQSYNKVLSARIQLIDGWKFLKHQVSIKSFVKDECNINCIHFFKYLPY